MKLDNADWTWSNDARNRWRSVKETDFAIVCITETTFICRWLQEIKSIERWSESECLTDNWPTSVLKCELNRLRFNKVKENDWNDSRAVDVFRARSRWRVSVSIESKNQCGVGFNGCRVSSALMSTPLQFSRASGIDFSQLNDFLILVLSHQRNCSMKMKSLLWGEFLTEKRSAS